MNTDVAVKRVGIIRTPNHPIYRRFSVDVIQAQKRDQRFVFSRLARVAIMVFSSYGVFLKLFLLSFNISSLLEFVKLNRNLHYTEGIERFFHHTEGALSRRDLVRTRSLREERGRTVLSRRDLVHLAPPGCLRCGGRTVLCLRCSGRTILRN